MAGMKHGELLYRFSTMPPEKSNLVPGEATPYVTAISGTYGGGKSKKFKAQSLEHKGDSISEGLRL